MHLPSLHKIEVQYSSRAIYGIAAPRLEKAIVRGGDSGDAIMRFLERHPTIQSLMTLPIATREVQEDALSKSYNLNLPRLRYLYIQGGDYVAPSITGEHLIMFSIRDFMDSPIWWLKSLPSFLSVKALDLSFDEIKDPWILESLHGVVELNLRLKGSHQDTNILTCMSAPKIVDKANALWLFPTVCTIDLEFIQPGPSRFDYNILRQLISARRETRSVDSVQRLTLSTRSWSWDDDRSTVSTLSDQIHIARLSAEMRVWLATNVPTFAVYGAFFFCGHAP